MFCESFPKRRKKQNKKPRTASVPLHTDLRQKNVKILLPKFFLLLPYGDRLQRKS